MKTGADRGPRAHLLCVAARSPASLSEATAALASELERIDDAHLARWLSDHRPPPGPYRLAIVATSAVAAASALRDALRRHRERDPRPRFFPPEIAFVFPGQGVQRPGMGLELMPMRPFAAAIDALDRQLRPRFGAPLAEVFLHADLDDTATTQPALMALACALAETLRALGIMPTAALGHSVGELGAAWLAGCVPLEAMLALVGVRASLMAALPERGKMAVVRADARAVCPLLDDGVAIAALNGPSSTVISGRADAVDAVLARASAHGLDVRALAISQASHCALLDPMLAGFERAAAAYDALTSPPRLSLASTLFGTLFGLGPCPERPDAAYWRRHAREPVRFEAAAHALADRGVELFVELGPEPSLARLELTPGAPWRCPLDPRRPAHEALCELLAEAFRRGADIDAGPPGG